MDKNSFLIDYDLVALKQDAGAYKANYAWAEPSEDHLAALLRTVVECPEEAGRRAGRGRRTIQERCSVKDARLGRMPIDSNGAL